MALIDRLRAELDAGAPRLAGALVSVRLPVRQAVIDDVLARAPGLPAGVSVLVGPAGRLQVRYGAFHANATLRREAVLRPRPHVVLELASQLVAWGLGRLKLPPFVRVDGRLVRIALDEGPLSAIAPIWPHVRSLTFHSMPGGLDVVLEAHVAHEAHP